MRILTTAAPIALAAALAAGGAFAQNTTEQSQTRDGEQATTSSPNTPSTTGAVVADPEVKGETETSDRRDGEADQPAGTTAVGDAAPTNPGETDSSKVRDGEMANTNGASANADAAKIEVGMLTCDLTQSSNAIVLSSSEYLCELEASDGYNDATYIASIDMVGLDLKATNSETLKWAVLTSSEQFETAMLEGEYVGASASAAVGAGAGVRAMVGGSADSVSLQPVSVSGSTGIGASLGLEQMELRRAN